MAEYERMAKEGMRGDGRRPRYDAVVVGAGSAGLSAALMLGRSRRRVLVLDGGEPRNAPSAGVHYFFTRDGTPPEELLRIGREQLGAYPSVEVREARVAGVTGSNGDFEVALEDRTVVGARKILLATGVHDELPDRPGFRELWGRGIYHCPYCHGWEVRDRPLAVLAKTEHLAMQVTLIRNWSRDLVALTDGEPGFEPEVRDRLAALDVPVKEEKISLLEGDADGSLRRIVFEDGSEIAREGLFYAPPQRQRSDLAESLGCEIEAMGLSSAVVKGDPTTKETTVPGVFVAGDAGTMLQGAIMAAASGATAAAFANHALATEDTEADLAARHESGRTG
ncbi:MAG: NAD(P)/FAD-dependent oxidoreductase [Rubrobacter sp.]